MAAIANAAEHAVTSQASFSRGVVWLAGIASCLVCSIACAFGSQRFSNICNSHSLQHPHAAQLTPTSSSLSPAYANLAAAS
jgi:hypothetical protein